MLLFLDKRKTTKYDILLLLAQNEEHVMTFTELENATELSGPTLRKLLIEIQLDLREQYQEDILIEIREGNKRKYYLQYHKNFLLKDVLHTYLHDSLKFNIMNEFFFRPKINFEDLAELHFISTSTLRREIVELQDLLQSFELSIEGFTTLELVGKEKHLRLFFSYFFLNMYQLKIWPFKNVSFPAVLELVDLIPAKLYSKEDVYAKGYVAYSFAVFYTRQLQGFPIKQEAGEPPFYFDEYSPEFLASHQKLKDYVITLLPEKDDYQYLDQELRFLYSLIFCYIEYHTHEDIFPSFFINQPYFSQNKTFEPIYRDTHSLLTQLGIAEKNPQFQDVLYKIMTLHYRILLFGRPYSACDDRIIKGDSKLHTSTNFFNIIYKNLVKKIKLEHYSEPWINDYLVAQYSLIGTQLVSSLPLKKELTVLLIADQAYYQYIIDTITSLILEPYLKINFVYARQVEELDVIISDTAIDINIFTPNSETPIIYFEPNSQFFSVEKLVTKLIKQFWHENEYFLN